ncbi:tripartite tricarboxylate transporter substrate binding protein [Ramlibacter sp.]|uniref:Bug family tripartite tricarboxylate transporter substrate binding protein n=1 Tax=Ramlibacter sp. TaxID=1917967 RepID=UPI00262BECDA|nr:tripartite tricarboxylate transporter substrate binding protein [Ramlibacter sp.]MDB5954106.1 transporter [Ramlibacter sp.]
MKRRLVSCGLACVSLLGIWPVAAMAQDWPARTVRIVVPFAPGGAVDFMARELAQGLSMRLGKTFVVDNRPGASGVIGVDAVAKAPADGYTIVLANTGAIAISPHINKAMPYDALKDLVAVSAVAKVTNVMVVPSSFAARSVKQFIAIAKAAPGKINFASSGVGASDQMAAEQFMAMAGIRMTNVPYKGGGPAMIDVLSGNVDVIFSTFPPAVPYMKSGKLRALGVTSATRLEIAPDVPTIAEAGVPGYESDAWYGVFAPAGTPPAIVTALNAEITAVLQDPALQKRLLEGAAAKTFTSSPKVFATFVAGESKRWQKIVQASGIVGE